MSPHAESNIRPTVDWRSRSADAIIVGMAGTPKLSRGQHLANGQRAEVGKELLKRYQSGRSIRELCADTGYSIGRVRRLLIDAGVEFRSRGGATRGKSKKA